MPNLGYLSAVLLTCAAGAQPSTPVILISVDTLRADHLGCYQAARKMTPHIDSIAKNATLFSQVSALVPLTLPSHVSLFTSTYQFANGVEDNGVPFAGTTLATVLKNAGYRTAAFVGSFVLDRRFGLSRDFDVYDSPFDLHNKTVADAGDLKRPGAQVAAAAMHWLDQNQHGNSYTFYLRYIGPLPGGGDVKVDITLSEHLAFPLERRKVLLGYPEFADIPHNRLLQVYSLQEISAEKVIALADRARNEPRDLYDLWYLASNQGIDLGSLTCAVRDKLGFRKLAFQGIAEAIARKEARLKALWANRLANQMTKLPPFDEVFRVLRRALRQADWP